MSDVVGNVESSLTARVGPLPAWAWAAILIGAYLVYEHFSGKGATTLPDAVPGAGPRPKTHPVKLRKTGGKSGDGQTVNTYHNNKAWEVGAIRMMVSQGYPAGPVTTALARYLADKTVTDTEAEYVSTAIRLVGPPPDPRQIRQGSNAT